MKRAKKLTVIVLTVIALLMTSCIYVIATSGDGTEGYYTYSKFNSKVTITDVDESISGAVEVPETIDGCEVIAIGEFAFENCSRVTSVSVPDCIKTIGRGAFKGMTSLEKVSVPYTGKSLNKTGYEGYFGYVFDYTTTETDGTVNQNGYYSYIPSSIKEVTVTQNSIIPGYAFQNCASVEKITAAKVTSCGSYSFRGCSSLTDFSSAAELKTIGDYAFGDCIGMTSIVIPASTTTIGAHAFDGCKNVKSIDFNDAETSIGDYAFANIPEITVLTVSKNATSIGRGAFYKDNKLTTVSIPYTGKSVDASGYEGVFGYIFDFTTSSSAFGITYQNINNYYYFIPTDIKTVTVTNDNRLADNAFYNCANITAVNLSRCTSLGNTAFGNCEKLSTVTLPDKLTSIGNSAFSNCTGLTAIQLPSSLKTIGNSAFYQCKNIKECNLPASLTTIGEYAFEGCSGVTELTVPDSVTSIGYGAFIGMPLTKLTVPFIGKGMTSTDQDGILGYWFGSGSIKQLYNSSTYVSCAIPTTLKEVTVTRATRIPYGAFSNCSFIEKIDIPDTVTSIEDRAFYNCSGLTSLTTTEKITSIGNSAMAGCPNLTVFGVKDSYTNTYCTERNIPFVAYGEIASIAVKQAPTARQYVGNALNTTGLVLTATTADGTSYDVTSGYTVSGDKFDAAGEKTVTVSYNGKEASFKVNVIGVSAIMITSAPAKTTYFVGDTLNCSGLTFRVSYSDGTTAVKMSDYTTNVSTFTKSGEQIVRVYYYGANGVFKVYVNAVNIKNVEIETEPTKKTYFAGDAIDLAGLTLKVTYDNGTTATVDKGFTTSTTLDSSAVTTVVVDYQGFKVSYEVQVTDVVRVSWAMTSEPTKLEYQVGDSLDTTGLVITEYYNNGTSKEFTTGFTCTPDNFTEIGEQIVTVTYAGSTTMFVVNVTEKVHEHNYTSTVTKNATCTEAGIRTFTCECGDTYQESIDALGHDFGEWTVTKPATCTEKGIETRHCSRCDATETRETDKTEHVYTAVVTPPTCTEKGYTTHTCSCGDSYVDSYVDALGHDFGERTVTKPATCTEKGIETRHCSRCDATETRETDKTEHVYTAVVTPPTCTEKGYTTHTCSCGDSYVDSYVDATGHTEGEWMVTKQPTVDEDGERTLYCSVCGAAIRTESISKLPKGKVHSVEISDIKINYRETAKITPKIEVDDDVTYTVRYESSDPKIATVDENGNVTAMKRGSGSATIKCIVTDQYGNTVEDTCTVNVRLSFAQILITYLLFGWIWY